GICQHYLFSACFGIIVLPSQLVCVTCLMYYTKEIQLFMKHGAYYTYICRSIVVSLLRWIKKKGICCCYLVLQHIPLIVILKLQTTRDWRWKGRFIWQNSVFHKI